MTMGWSGGCRKWILASCYLWFATSFGYYGLIYNAGSSTPLLPPAATARDCPLRL